METQSEPPYETGEILRTRIKVCGITDRQEARAIVAAGVDALGFIFAPKSPRRIEPEQAREIIRALPPFVDAVGVFVDDKPDLIDEIIQYCGLTMVQLHGAETPGCCAEISSRVIKVFRLGPEMTEGPAYERYAGTVSAYLLDTYDRKMAGGTGRPFDWLLAVDFRPPGPMILAGGLGPGNVAEAVRRVRPFAVDLNSGVEIEPGRKDIDKVREAVERVRQADRDLHPSAG